MTDQRNIADSNESLVRMYERLDDFTHPVVTDEMIRLAESELQVNLPDDYICFLKDYGQGGFSIFAILGFNSDGSPVFVDATEDYRLDYNLPLNLVVIEEAENDIFCIDTIDGKIVSWDYHTSEYIFAYHNFRIYFHERILDAVTDPEFIRIRSALYMNHLSS